MTSSLTYDWSYTFPRFVNLVHNTDMSVGKIWSVVKSVRLETPNSHFRCGENHVLNNQVSQVTAVEKRLRIEPSELILHNLTKTELTIAAELFIYLAVCPGTFNTWIEFYKDLFENQSLSQILLALNRVMKDTKTVNDDYFKRFAKNITSSLMFRKLTTILEKDVPGGAKIIDMKNTLYTNSLDVKGILNNFCKA